MPLVIADGSASCVHTCPFLTLLFWVYLPSFSGCLFSTQSGGTTEIGPCFCCVQRHLSKSVICVLFITTNAVPFTVRHCVVCEHLSVHHGLGTHLESHEWSREEEDAREICKIEG